MSSDSEDDGRPELKGRAKWLKRTVEVVVNEDLAVRTTKRETKTAKGLTNEATGAKKKKDYDKEPGSKKTYAVDDKMTEEELDKRVSELVASRGRKGTAQREVLRQLEQMTKTARSFGAHKEIPVLMHLISSMFDTNKNIDEYMDLNQWRTCHRSLFRILKLLANNEVIALVQLEEVSDVLGKNMVPIKDSQEEEDATPSDPNVIKVRV